MAADILGRTLDLSHDVLFVSDIQLAKALKVAELEQIARAEQRLRSYWFAQWEKRAVAAAKQAGTKAGRGGTADGIADAVAREMGHWPSDVRARTDLELARAYRLARAVGARKAKGKIKFDLEYSVPAFKAKLSGGFDVADERAIRDIQTDAAIWIGRHYDQNVRDGVRAAIEPVLVGGAIRRNIVDRVADVVRHALDNYGSPEGYRGTSRSYCEGLAANVVTNSRVRGQLVSFNELGVKRARLTNPNDDRTSLICQHLDGKEFEVRAAIDLMTRLSGVYEPDEVKALQPWPSYEELLKVSPEAGKGTAADMAALEAAGIILPPFHFRCRTTVDIVS